MKRKTVVAYVKSAVDRTERALAVAAKSPEISNAEIVLIRSHLLGARELAARLERRK